MGWRVNLSPRADADLDEIRSWTEQRFGRAQAARYGSAFEAAFLRLSRQPDGAGTRDRADLAQGVRSLHVRSAGLRGRHLILYRLRQPDVVEILRVLHDAMDLPRHLPPDP